MENLLVAILFADAMEVNVYLYVIDRTVCLIHSTVNEKLFSIWV